MATATNPVYLSVHYPPYTIVTSEGESLRKNLALRDAWWGLHKEGNHEMRYQLVFSHQLLSQYW